MGIPVYSDGGPMSMTTTILLGNYRISLRGGDPGHRELQYSCIQVHNQLMELCCAAAPSF